MVLYIFCAENTWLYKIGHTKSNSSKTRLKSCQTGNPHKILLEWEYNSPYAKEIEKMAHNHFSHFRKAGEWFLFDTISIHEVKEKIITFEKTLKILENEEKISD